MTDAAPPPSGEGLTLEAFGFASPEPQPAAPAGPTGQATTQDHRSPIGGVPLAAPASTSIPPAPRGWPPPVAHVAPVPSTPGPAVPGEPPAARIALDELLRHVLAARPSNRHPHVGAAPNTEPR